MFPPFMLPESLIGARVADPVGIHVGEEVGLTGGGQNGGDVGVGARGVAVGVEGSVTVVWPMHLSEGDEDMGEDWRTYHKP